MKSSNKRTTPLDGKSSRNESEPSGDSLYLDASASIEERVNDLMGSMTLEEKVAQVSAVSLRDSTAEEEGLAGKVKAVRDGITNGIGQIENTFDPRCPRESVEEVNDLQRLLFETTRLKIPALIGSECLHGHAGYNSTVFPVPLAMASSWNVELLETVYNSIAKEARARGAHEAHTPVLDLGRDPRWGRIEETYGEDTYLATRIGVAAISGLQGGCSGNPGTSHIVAAPKHFAGYGQVSGGRNFATTPIETKTLHDEILPPFEVSVKEANVLGMMASHCDIGGVPAHGNRWLLTELLREEWGFEGFVVSDYNDVPRLDVYHHVVASIEEAAGMAISAGMDVDLPVGEAYWRLEKVIEEKPELETALDVSVRRVLRLKFLLGLFENRYSDPEEAERVVGSSKHVDLAERIACESIVLLKNEQSLLPLDLGSIGTIAVVGPNAASMEIGNYTVKNDFVVSILEGVKQRAGTGVEVLYEEGCEIGDTSFETKETVLNQVSLEEELPKIHKAVEAVKRSDVAVVCVGGNTQTAMEAFYVPGIKGDRSTLGLLGNQSELVYQVLDTGVPTVVVLMGGRPYSIPEISEKANAIINTFYLGQTNGAAVSKVLFGDVNPSGKLPVTVPRSVGQLPMYYSQKAQSFYKDYLDEDAGPLYPFGFGLSYTTFHYSELVVEKKVFGMDEKVSFSIELTNSGKVAGAEVVQVYFRDLVASIIRPEKLLVRFEKVFLEAGEVREVCFSLDPKKDLSFTGIDMTQVVEPGVFEVMVGGSSADIRERVQFELA